MPHRQTVPTIETIEGQSVLFSSLWQNQAVFITWLRHYGWMFCREQAAQLKSIYPTLVDLDIGVVAIGNGTHLMAQDFVEQFAIPYPVYTDEKRATYDLMNMHRGFGIGLGTLKAGLALTKKGTKQGSNQGDIWQQGGEALFAKGGALLWKHSNKTAEQHSTPAEILAMINQQKVNLSGD